MKLPVIKIEGMGIAEVWERSVLTVWNEGVQIKTEYDRPEDPPSRDAIVIMVVNEPFSEPRIHLGFPGGIEDLEKYRQEVIFGVHDHWINPEEGKWTYTYHDRIFNYHLPGKPSSKVNPVRKSEVLGPALSENKEAELYSPRKKPKVLRGSSPFQGAGFSNGVNQIEYIINKLSKTPYSRRAQALIWIPFYDPQTYDPPCLQRIWCRIFEDRNTLFLAMNTNWRSRDAYRAAFMNLFALTELQKYIADEISIKIGSEVKVGQYVDISDSYHIYGESFPDFNDRFLSILKKREFYNPERTKSRTIRSDDPAAVEGFQYGKKLLEMEKKTEKKGTTS